MYNKLKETYSIIYFYENSENQQLNNSDIMQTINQAQREFVEQVQKGRVRMDNTQNDTYMPKFAIKINSTFYKIVTEEIQPQLINKKDNCQDISIFDKIIGQIDQQDGLIKKENQVIDQQILEQLEQQIQIDDQSIQNEQLNDKNNNSIFSIDSITKVDKKKCKICFEKIANCIYLKCGHAGICYTCSLDVWEKQKKCHLCRKKIEALVQIDTDKKYVNNHYKIIAMTELKFQ